MLRCVVLQAEVARKGASYMAEGQILVFEELRQRRRSLGAHSGELNQRRSHPSKEKEQDDAQIEAKPVKGNMCRLG